ncbi:hypothetical protein [Cryptosporangium phraense]|uniref:Uncharacterized protein n=1 Tax=Cryptosporangium phraense TaxID=2593070 RepID=A0A545AP96_9ACTN|nr:hypothetical protein [Cryptosporangium phraense]TQS43137.1 hypothetical protein FL583_20000 [Cryptosporangium phraense]
MNPNLLREVLAQVATDTPAETTVDSYRAAETAERLRRRRQRLVVAAAAALVLVVTATVALASAGLLDRPGPPARPAPEPARSAPPSFDPATTRLRIGFLPPGFDRWRQQLEAPGVRYQTTKDSTSGREIDVYLAARGAPLVPTAPMGGPARPSDPRPGDHVAGPTVLGRPSTWYPRDIAAGDNRAGELRFTWAPGAVGSVTLWDVGDAMKIAARIAETLRLDAEQPTLLPFTMTRPKVPLTRLEIAHYDRLSRPDGASSFSLVFPAEDGVGPGADVLVDTVTAGLSPDRRIGPWTVDVDHVDGRDFYSFQAQPETFVQVQPRPERKTAEKTGSARKLAESIVASFRMTGKMRYPSTWSS